MGKQRQYKALRKLARDLPPATETVEVDINVKGAQLIAQGLKKWDGKKIVPGLTYTGKGDQERQVNHGDRLKKAYEKGGPAAVAKYLREVITPAKKIINNTIK